MTEMRSSIDNWVLHAYADGELESQERAEVERRLETDREARLFVEAIRQEKLALKTRYDAVLEEPVPHVLRQAARNRSEISRNPAARIAASLVILMLGAAAGWMVAHWTSPNEELALSQRALLAHAVYAEDVRHPVEVAAAESEHLKTWLSKRVGVDVKIPDLEARGLTFIGGRLLAAEDRPAGQLMYEDANKRRVALYLVHNKENRETALRMINKDGVWACYWLDGDMAFVVTGEMPREQMSTLAEDIYEQLEG